MPGKNLPSSLISAGTDLFLLPGEERSVAAQSQAIVSVGLLSGSSSYERSLCRKSFHWHPLQFAARSHETLDAIMSGRFGTPDWVQERRFADCR